MRHIVRNLTPPDRAGQGGGDNYPPQHYASALDAASFIEGMAAEMRIMARDAQLNALSYFLEMVRIEASAEIARLAKTGGPSG
ncbi:hypothetical protein [Bosea sp. BH3]|uniref:hypothetical protein n=1 Tax=Bosea sp. BH3 TaxID=2871701 RepID=UPI0021CB0E65|nr:hypothetical protein [Bosea sp. BH3]MCU4180424.1 hypothetical protein [Bosea sp. BH3]